MFGDEAVTREILGNVPPWLVGTFYVLAAASCTVAVVVFARRRFRHRQGRADEAAGPHVSRRERIRRGLRYLALHEELRRDPFAGWAHLLMFYGFLILFVGTCLVFLEHDTPLHFFYGWFYLWASLVIDLGGVAFLAGLSMFLYRRMRNGEERILRAWWVTSLSVLLLVIGVTGFLLEGARIAVDLPPHERYSIVGYSIAQGFRALGGEGETAVRWQQWLWGGHAAACIAFFGLLPWGFFSHMVFGLAAATDRAQRPLSQLAVTPLAPDRPPGARSWRDFSPRDLLQADACTTCGRCNAACPAAATGKPLHPREIILELRRQQSHDSSGRLPLAIAEEELWSCTTCAACSHACPVGIDVYTKLIQLRRGLVETGNLPDAAVDVFESIAERHNPFGKPDSDRMLWAHGLDVPVARLGEQFEVLYWIGCSGSFSPEGRAVARAMVRILNHLKIDYRVLGTAERCTGDPARRMGEEGLFRKCAAHNLSTLGVYGVRHVITHCPHCFNTLRNEYPAVDGTNGSTFTVQHHSEFLAGQIACGRLRGISDRGESVTFHDPCYLGRGNSVANEPRDVLTGLNLPIVEMPRSRENSFCCGAGGGSMWLVVRGSDRIENQRFREAAGTGARIVGTACPFCKTMLDAARQSSEHNGAPPPRVMDIAELVAAAHGL